MRLLQNLKTKNHLVAIIVVLHSTGLLAAAGAVIAWAQTTPAMTIAAIASISTVTCLVSLWLCKSTFKPATGSASNTADNEPGDDIISDIHTTGNATDTEHLNQQLEVAAHQANLMAHEAMAANRAKNKFLANVSHDIRTPMNAIIGFAELLGDESLTGEQAKYVANINEASTSLLGLINDILDFSKIEAGKFDTEIVDCSMGQMLTTIETLLQPAAIKKGVRFEVLQCSKLPANIRTDPVRLRQCLINLVNNAIKFTEQGHVYLNVFLGEKDNKPFIHFDVEDTGIGIPFNKQKLIFESFSQASSNTSRKFGGTGLGLAITKQLATLLGGGLTLTSQEGKGSMFSFVIPANIDMKEQPLLDKYEIVNTLIQKPLKTKSQIKFSGHALVVEDAKANQTLIKILLGKFGLQVTIAEDGEEAVEKATAESFDLILMDIQMPNMNGYEATRLLRQKGLKTPIIALTANAMKGDDEKCKEAGCDDYLSKPVDRGKIAAVLKKYLVTQNTKETADPSKKQPVRTDQHDNETTDQSPPAERGTSQDGDQFVDWALAIKYCGGEDVIKRVAESILEDGPETLIALKKAIEAGNCKDIMLYAHKLKGVVMTLGAVGLPKKALQLEKAAQQEDLTEAQPLFNEVEIEFNKLASYLSDPDWVKNAKQQNSHKEQIEQT